MLLIEIAIATIAVFVLVASAVGAGVVLLDRLTAGVFGLSDRIEFVFAVVLTVLCTVATVIIGVALWPDGYTRTASIGLILLVSIVLVTATYVCAALPAIRRAMLETRLARGSTETRRSAPGGD